MAKQFPGAGKAETGGTKVIPGSRRKNPVPPLKKEHREFYSANFSALSAPIAGLNRFPRRKNSSNGSDSRPPADLRADCGRDRGTGYTVTTRHVFSVFCRRAAASLLPISQPNSAFRGRKCNQRAEGGGGGQPDAVAESLVSINSHGNFIPMAPHPNLLALKKTRYATAAQFQLGPGPGLSHELAAIHR